MKTQIIKIIPCLVAGFILSACVGAVNIPSDVADGLIEPANPCIANPFGDTCGGAEFNNARKIACIGSNSNQCAPIITRVCEADSLDALCADRETYYSAQHTACEGESDSARCALTVTRICDVNPLDTLCTGKATYFPVQKRVCEGESNSPRCKETFRRICDGDVLNPYCVESTAHSEVQRATCESEPNSVGCAPIIARDCKAHSLFLFCAGKEIYYPAQKTACESEPNSERCRATYARVCDGDVFNPYCSKSETHYPARKTACESEPNSERCRATFRRVCDETPFSEVCQERNLTTHDLPFNTIDGSFFNARITTNEFKNSRHSKYSDYSNIVNREFFSDNNSTSVSGGCTFRETYRTCQVSFPKNIDIVPLNNNNTGMATYSGSVSVNTGRTYSSVTANIDITVNFGDSTLSYSGDLVSTSNPFNINGSFTKRGIITGSATYRGDTSDLWGLIGQDRAIGGFIGQFKGNGGGFAGGFTATRE